MARFSRRSWGWYFVLWNAKRFKVKILKFNDQCTCSLQYHYHRNELWLFLYGGGKFDLNEKREYINRGDFIMVNAKALHRFYSIGCSWVLEIQYGDKCEEGDIVRL